MAVESLPAPTRVSGPECPGKGTTGPSVVLLHHSREAKGQGAGVRAFWLIRLAAWARMRSCAAVAFPASCCRVLPCLAQCIPASA